jgi:hypothetical protein
VLAYLVCPPRLLAVVPAATQDSPLYYLPREVFFGRLGFAGAFFAVFFAVWVSDFGRFLPATSHSSRFDVLPGAP